MLCAIGLLGRAEMTLRSSLSDQDMDRWAIALRATPEDPLGLVPWLVKHVKQFFPFERALLVHGEQVAGEIRVTHLVSHGHTDDYIGQLSRTFDLHHRGCLTWWFTHRAPFCIDLGAPPPFVSAFELDEIRRFKLGRIAAHGVVNPAGTAGTYFSFGGVPRRPDEWLCDALRLIAPMLNDLFLRNLAAADPVDADQPVLTPRQKDIVRLAARGLNSKAIGSELLISEKTVRNQLSVIYRRIGVSNYREMLVAMRLG
jgi:DNA-binding CsgD family transcriptional regulator